MKKNELTTRTVLLAMVSLAILCSCADDSLASNGNPPTSKEADALLPPNNATGIGRLMPSEMSTYVDPTTKLKWTRLTNRTKNTKRVYQTDPSFTFDSKWVLCYSSDRKPGSSQSQGYLINRTNGQFIQITEGSGVIVHSMFLSRKEYKVWYNYKINSTTYELRSTDIGLLLKDAATGVIGDASKYIKTIWQYPNMRLAGGISLDANEDKIYIGFLEYKYGESVPPANQGTTPIYSRIISVDLKTCDTMTIVRNDFKLGHLQANPWVSGQVAYCWETAGAPTNAGDAPQRMWMVNSDGTGKQPLYPELETEWITHESWAGPNHMAFCSRRGQPVPADEQTRPTGIRVVNVNSGSVTSICQIPESVSKRGFWHCNGGNNGLGYLRWFIGDCNEGKVYLYNKPKDILTLITAGHPQKPDHTHPIFSPDNRYILIQTGLFSDGELLDLMFIDIDDIPEK